MNKQLVFESGDDPITVEIVRDGRLRTRHHRSGRLRRRSGDGVVQVVSTAGDTHLGGDDIDQLEETIAICRKRNVSVSVVGPSAILDPWGRVQGRTGIFSPEVLRGRIEPVRERFDELSDEELFRRAQALSQIGEVRIAEGRLDAARRRDAGA